MEQTGTEQRGLDAKEHIRLSHRHRQQRGRGQRRGEPGWWGKAGKGEEMGTSVIVQQ